jgi:hypothetical protein
LEQNKTQCNIQKCRCFVLVSIGKVAKLPVGEN